MRLDWQLMRVALADDGRCAHTPQLQIGIRAAQIFDLTLAGALVDTVGGAQLRPDRDAADTLNSPLLAVLQATEAVIPWDQLFYNQLGDVPHGTKVCAQDMIDAAVWSPVDKHRWLPTAHHYADADDAERKQLRASVVAAIDDPAAGHDVRLRLLAYSADASQLFGATSRSDCFDVMHRYADRLHVTDTRTAHALDKALWAAANDWHRAVSGFGINLSGV